MGDSTMTHLLMIFPALLSVAIAVFFIVLAVRLVRAVERIADKLG